MRRTNKAVCVLPTPPQDNLNTHPSLNPSLKKIHPKKWALKPGYFCSPWFST